MPFDLVLGGVNPFQDAAVLDVHDDAHRTRLHRRLFEIAAVQSAARYPYLPHVTIAHYTREAPIDGLAADLARWRDPRFAGFPVTEVEIVTLRLGLPYDSLEPYAVLPLGGETGGSPE